MLSRFVENPQRHQLKSWHFTPEVAARAGFDFSGLTYPVGIDQIDGFEKRNGLSVNVYGVDRVERFGEAHSLVYPLRVAKEEKPEPNHYDLLYLTDSKSTHYAWITNFERLVGSQLSKRGHRIHICKRCFAHFDDQLVARGGLCGARRLAEHRLYCSEHAALRTDPPSKEHILFERHERTQRVQYTVYADFECALVPVEENVQGPPSTVPAPQWDPANDRPGLPHHRKRRADVAFQSGNVTTRKVHKPYAYAYYVADGSCRSNDGDANVTGNRIFPRLRMYRGADASAHFMRSLRADVKRIGDLLYAQRQLIPRLSDQEEAAFGAATACHLCGGSFVPGAKKSARKVRDHQHSAPYRFVGAAHSGCNLRRREQDVVNVYFHNLSNYDAHFVVRELGLDSGDVRVLANTEEKYISFTKRYAYPDAGRRRGITVRFVDSYRFLSRALSTLVDILPAAKLRVTRQFFPEPEQFDLVRRKGVFPYEYVTSASVLDEERQLPPASAFHDSLRLEDVKAEDYAHAQNVWARFHCQTLGDYADVYLKTDVVLLTDVFESFRDMCLEHYGLDPAHYITLPSYAWDVMLRLTGVTLETLQDVDMYLFFEKGIRGGLTQCVTRHVVADNKFTRNEGAGSDGADDDTYLMYYDANNLYGWAMSQPLPYGGFRWLAPEEIAQLDVTSIPEDADTGYVLEVDLEYPQDHGLHDRHRDMPFLPEMRKAPRDRLPYSTTVLNGGFGVGRNAKLMVTLTDKEHYVVHYRLLRQALENGLRVRRVHRVLRFSQSCWLQPYVHLNTELRRKAQNKFEVELFKLMVNAVYGMSLQNVRKHIDIRMATNPVSYTKLVAKSNFSDRTWYTEDLALVHMHKTHVVLDKPVYVGMCVLDHSKWWMYRFHYEMVDRYGGTCGGAADRISLVYQDTDSLLYAIRTRDAYHDMTDHLADFDTSNYPQDHPLHDMVNARVLGKFKDEAAGHIVGEFVGLMSKLYCIVFHPLSDTAAEDDVQVCPAPLKKAKGINRAVVARHLTVEDYRQCLHQQTVKETENQRFQSRHHVMYSVLVRKRSLAPYDDKRYVVMEDGGVQTLPWGHYAVPAPSNSGNNSNGDDVEM